MDSIKLHINFLQEQTNQVLTELRNIRNQFLTLNSTGEKRIDGIQIYVKRASDHFEKVKSFVSSHDRPGWIVELTDAFKAIPTGKSQAEDSKFFEKISRVILALESFKWGPQNVASGDEIDFNAIYLKCLNESRLTSLFDEVEKILTKIIESKEIDSLKLIKSIENIAATIRKNYKRDYFSVYCTKEFVFSFCKNLIVEELRSIPGLGPVVTALEKSLAEVESEWQIFNEKMSVEIKEVAKAKNPKVGYTERGFLSLIAIENKTDLKG